MVLSTPFPPTEGIGYYTYNLSKILIEKGHEVIVLTRSSNNKIQKQEMNGIKIIRAPFIPFYPFYLYIHGKSMNKIFKQLESDVDIVHIHSPLPSLIKTNLPTLLTIHTPMLTDYRLVKMQSFYGILSKISARIVSYPQELKLINASDIITTSTNSIANELKDHYLNGKKVIVTGNGVDENIYLPGNKAIEKDKKYILFVGRMDREKGLFDLVESGKYICKKRSDVFFIIAGKGKDMQKVQNKVKKAGLQNKFIFMGQVEEDKLVKLYQNASIFVLPSYHEGLPTVLLEAMSCGLPVIATDVRGNRDLISNNENGIIVRPRSPKKLADAIISLLDNEKTKEILGKNARKTIIDNYTWAKISDKFISSYESLLQVET
jgi:glycosyltransferase involved in cell wall biosynthesis